MDDCTFALLVCVCLLWSPDWDLEAVMEPAEALGVFCGAILRRDVDSDVDDCDIPASIISLASSQILCMVILVGGKNRSIIDQVNKK